jgi:protoporphyrinogen oxidase
MKIGIIGAGAAGLAAAYDLAKDGHAVAVYERSPFVGGQASTFDVGGAPLERGYHHLFTSDTDMVDLVHEIGLGDRMRWIESTVGTFHGGKIYNFVSALDLLRFKPLSLLGRVRLGLLTLYLQRKKDWKDFEDITAHEWLLKRAGRRGYEAFWGPLLRGKFGERYYDQVGMTWVWGKIHTRFASRGKGLGREKLGYPIGSFGEVFDVLADEITQSGGTVETSTTVSRVAVDEGRVAGLSTRETPATWISPQPLTYQPDPPEANDTSVEQYQDFDAVIATSPSYVLPKLVEELPAEYLAKLTGTEYLSAVLVILVLDRPLSNVYWLNVADRSIPFVGVIEQTNFLPPDQYGGRHIVYLSNYLGREDPLYGMAHSELLREYIPHLRKINPDFDEAWIQESYHHRVDAAQPIVGVNYSSRIPDHRTPVTGLYLANTTQVYPEDRGTNYSVRMGRRVARMLMDDLA